MTRSHVRRLSALQRVEPPRSMQHNSQNSPMWANGVWDAKAARDLGWRFIGIGSGEQADRLRQAGAGMVIPDYRPAEGFLDLLAD